MWQAIIPAVMDFAANQYENSRQNSLAQKTSKNDFWMNFAAQNYFMDKQNEYNKPVNQMKRLQEAGLNPNLVYGSGNAIMSSAGPSGGGMDTHLTQSSARLNMLGAIQALRNQRQQEKQIDANIDATNANIDLAKARLAMQADYQALQYGLSKRRLDLASKALGIREKDPKTSLGKWVNDIRNLLSGSDSFNNPADFYRSLMYE